MKRIRLRYFEQEDVLHLLVSDKLEKSSIELSPNITVELNDNNEVVGVEILKATGFLLSMLQGLLQSSSFPIVGQNLPDSER
jgi:uncharacterized protein YuzE